ncbi:pilus assembly protein PilZ [Shimia sp. SDUM112013]|uniref:pilus assembly protein PilZ n=1 Tax=Shimia sp. SDUM112013 TaxID=3136160 RepID=UPI0032ED8FE3
MTNKTPARVAAQATQSGVLKKGTLTLIGIAGSTTAPRALILTQTGRVVTAELGKRSSVGTVVGISEDTVVLKRGGQTTTLKMPG